MAYIFSKDVFYRLLVSADERQRVGSRHVWASDRM